MRNAFSALALAVVATTVGCGENPSNSAGGGGSGGGQGGNGGHGGSTGVGNLKLDPSYGTDGIAWATRAYSTDFVSAAAWTSDGGILQGGSTGGNGDFYPSMLLAKLDGAGQLDTAFGDGGFVVWPLGDGGQVTSIAPLPDGGALVAGSFYSYAKSSAFVARVDAKGALDMAFGDAGMIAVETDPFDDYVKVLRTDSGQVLLTATSGDVTGGAWLWRFDADGKPDVLFGDGGHANLGDDTPRDLLLLPDGSILALIDGSSSGYLVHVETDGTLDSSFGTNGKATVGDEPYDVEPSQTGNLLVAGGDSVGWLTRLDATGALDTTFGLNGVINPMTDDPITSLAGLPNGDILAVTSIVASYPLTLFRSAVRFAPDGTSVPWDTGFNTPVYKALNGSNVGAVLLKNGDIYFTGSRPGPSDADDREVMTFAVKDDATPVDAFGTAGLAQAGSKAPPEVLWDMARRSDGSLIATGAAGTKGVFARFADGKHDLAFGADGFAPVVTLVTNGITVDSTDRIVATTLGYNIARYAPDGTPDTMFGNNGTLALMAGNGLVADIEVDAKKRIVVGGEAIGQGALLARVLDDGTLDPSFGTGGVVIGAAGVTTAGAAALVVEPDGKIAFVALAGGTETYFGRVLEDGTTDTSFGTNGNTLVPMKLRAFRLIPRKAGGYLAAGSDWWCATDPACATVVVALSPDGQLDASFGDAGMAKIADASYFQAWQGLAELPDGTIVVAGATGEDGVQTLAVWALSADGTQESGAAPFTLPGRGRATSAIVDGNSLLVGGWGTHPKTGTDMVTLRFTF